MLQFPESAVVTVPAVAAVALADDVPADGHQALDGVDGGGAVAAADPRPSLSASAGPGRPPAALQRCSAAARDMVGRMLDRDPRRRLRTLHSLQTIAFYLNFNFADVRAKKVGTRDDSSFSFLEMTWKRKSFSSILLFFCCRRKP